MTAFVQHLQPVEPTGPFYGTLHLPDDILYTNRDGATPPNGQGSLSEETPTSDGFTKRNDHTHSAFATKATPIMSLGIDPQLSDTRKPFLSLASVDSEATSDDHYSKRVRPSKHSSTFKTSHTTLVSSVKETIEQSKESGDTVGNRERMRHNEITNSESRHARPVTDIPVVWGGDHSKDFYGESKILTTGDSDVQERHIKKKEKELRTDGRSWKETDSCHDEGSIHLKEVCESHDDSVPPHTLTDSDLAVYVCTTSSDVLPIMKESCHDTAFCVKITRKALNGLGEALPKREIWGDGFYHNESNILLMLVHASMISLDSLPVDDVVVVFQTSTDRIKLYHSSYNNCVRTRSCHAPESVYGVRPISISCTSYSLPSYAHRCLTPSLSTIPLEGYPVPELDLRTLSTETFWVRDFSVATVT